MLKWAKRFVGRIVARQMRAYANTGAVGCLRCGFPHVDIGGNDTFLKTRHKC